MQQEWIHVQVRDGQMREPWEEGYHVSTTPFLDPFLSGVKLHSNHNPPANSESNFGDKRSLHI
jgi:hypothetical protein